MKLGKLIFLIILGVLGYQNQLMVVKYLHYLKNVHPVILTYVEINSFTGRLSAYANENNGRLPENIAQWLNQNFKSTQKADISIDYFGSPYEVAADKDTAKEFLISCGPDTQCQTSDDIELK